MKSTQHGDHLTQLTRFGLVNCYLVREPDGLTLIDTGITGSAGSLISAAGELAAPIVRIVLTHGHQDHAGSLDALAGKLPDAEILLPERDARFMRGDKSLDTGERAKQPASIQHCKCAAGAKTFTAGDRVGSLEVIATPGHTPGHVAFRDTRDGSLIAGDVFTSVGGVKTSTKPRLPFPFAAIATWDKAVDLESARALCALDVSRLALGHGPVIEAPAEQMSAAVARG